MIQVINFNAIQNQDDSPEVIPMGSHIMARNGKFIGPPGKLRFQNVPGNQVINNPFLPIGNNTCIGGMYDQVKNRIIWANWNSQGTYALFIMDVATKTINRLILNGFNTVGDPLLFTTQGMMLNWNIVYGDSTQGDVLFFTNSQKQPCQINIDKALTGAYGPIKKSFIDVCREQPIIPPQVIYQDDPTVTVNNLRKKLFRVKTREIFENKDKGAWGAISEVPLPLEPFDHTVDADPTKNCVIPIVFQTGDSNVKKIEIAGQVSLGATWSDFFSIITLDKFVLSIPDNDISTYLFYNDKAYTDIDPTEGIQEFDDCPLEANAQELLSGNVLLYGGVKKGYNNLTNINSPVTSSIQTSDITTNKFYLFFVAQGGQSYGAGNIHIVVYGNVNEAATFKATMVDGSTITYTSGGATTTVNVINGLRADAISKGYAIISNDNNNLVVSKINIQLAYFNTTTISFTILNNSTWFVYDWWARQSFGIQYKDAKGRPVGGVQTNAPMSVQTIGYQEIGGVPQIQILIFSIYHIPPIDAVSYHIVRSKNLAENNFIYWISDRTFKDTQSGPDNNKYAYISIANLNTFVKNNPTSPLGYTFLANDRIRFVKRYNGDGTTANVYTNKDYEIVAAPENPTINGLPFTGQFIKIVLPTTDASFDFGSGVFSNYLIKLYTPAQPVANGLDVYYEFSEEFAIIDAGLSTRRHQGRTQNQSSNYATPALIDISKGDYYFRQRTINTGVEIIYGITPGGGANVNAGRVTLGMTPTSISYNDPNIVTGTSAYADLVGWSFSNPSRLVLKVITGNYVFRIQGTLSITFDADRSGDTYQFLLAKNDGSGVALSPVFDNSKAGTYTFPVDATFTLTTGQFVTPLGFSFPDFSHTRSMAATNLTITSQQFFTQGIIDPNFSDFLQSSVNSNGRPWIIDPNARQSFFGNVIQWGETYDPDTNINRISRFYSSNFDEIGLDKGDILRFKARERICRIFQARGVGQVGVWAKFIQDSKGQNTLTTTDSIITANNVQYYEGEFGLGNHPESLVSGKIQDYFVDPIRGYHIRLSNDGMIPISELYKGQYTIRGLLTPFNKVWTRPDGGVAKILGAYNYLDEEYICALQTGVNGLITLPAQTFSFNERRNAYCSYFDFTDRDFMLAAEETIYSWKNGQIYSHDNSRYCNFDGVQYPVNIIVPINSNLIEGKTWEAISQISNVPWEIPLLYTNSFSYGIQPQQTVLIPSDFTQLEHKWQAAFLRDINSIGGLINGDYIKGSSAVLTLQVLDSTDLVYLSEFAIHLLDSALTVK